MRESFIIEDGRIEEFDCKQCGFLIKYVTGRKSHVVCPICRKIYYLEDITLITQ